jgi:hypothetical protein
MKVAVFGTRPVGHAVAAQLAEVEVMVGTGSVR